MDRTSFMMLTLGIISSNAIFALADTEVTNKKLIPVEITKHENNESQARFTDVTEIGGASGISQMRMEGIAVENQHEVGKQVKVNWHSASFGDKKVLLDEEFASEAQVSNNLEKSDKLTAEGDPQVLLAAWKKLNQEDGQEKKSDKEQIVSRSISDVSGSNTSRNSESKNENQGTKFTKKEKDKFGTTTDGCPVKIDAKQMVAIVQERLTKNGIAEGDCSDTMTRIALEKDFTQCQIKIESDLSKVYKQYKLSYVDPKTNGKTITGDCIADTNSPVKVIETMEGCKNIVSKEGVILQKRKIATIDGEIKQLSQCYAVANANVIEKECSGMDRYSHDFTNHISYLNKTYSHMEDGQEKTIATCVASNVIFTHQYDNTGCSMTHDDNNRKSIIMGKTIIDDNKTQVTISDCRVAGEISYKQKSPKASANIGHTKEIIPANYEEAYIDGDKTVWGFWVRELRARHPNTWLANPRSPDDINQACYFLNKSACIGSRLEAKKGQKLYCVTGDASTPWVTKDGIAINHEKSDEKPIWDFAVTRKKISKETEFGFSCSIPRCSTSYITEHPTYLRADGSVFLNKDIILQDYYICGTGKNLK
jgi:hypothetical protein